MKAAETAIPKMTNLRFYVRHTLDVPSQVFEELAGGPDDGSDEWLDRAMDRTEEAIRLDPVGFISKYTAFEPSVSET